MEDSCYKYQPFRSPRAIRVLVLQPTRKQTDTLAGDLVEVSLDRSPKYDALSYTWGKREPGDDSPPKTLLCNDFPLVITDNCYDALMRLRQKRKPRRLWVDAVCIDQTSIEERNAQVTMMGEIYQCASHVIVWLGLGDAASDFVFGLMKEMSSWLRSLLPHQRLQLTPRMQQKTKKLVDRRWSSTLVPSESDSESGCPTPEGCLRSFCKRPYWTRMWTLQEFAANGKHTLLYCGSAKPVNAFFLDALSSVTWGLGDPPSKRLCGEIMRKSFRLHQACVRRSTQRGESEMVSEVLLEILSMEASEPRDKIYALRSVFSDIFGGMVVDYDAPLEDVYNEATRLIMTHGGDEASFARLLKEASDGDGEKWDRGIASWAVDWNASRDIQEGSDVTSWNLEGDCARDSLINAQFSSDNRMLSLRGVLLDEVVVVNTGGSLYQSTWNIMGPVMRTMAQFLRDIHASSSPPASLKLDLLRKLEVLVTLILGEEYCFVDGVVPRHLLEQLLAGILLADGDLDCEEWLCRLWKRPETKRGQHLGQETKQQLRAVVEESMLNIALLVREPTDDFLLFMSRLATKRDIELLFYTAEGRMGVCNSLIEAGDVIAGFSGLGNPFVLRPVADGAEGQFRLVGQAIVTGVMGGEVWPGNEDDLEWLHIV